MPSSTFWGPAGENLTMMVNNGSLPESRVTDMATRIVAAWYQMGQNVCLSPLSQTSVNLFTVRLPRAWNRNASQLLHSPHPSVCPRSVLTTHSPPGCNRRVSPSQEREQCPSPFETENDFCFWLRCTCPTSYGYWWTQRVPGRWLWRWIRATIRFHGIL
jgi:hypothetical protein